LPPLPLFITDIFINISKPFDDWHWLLFISFSCQPIISHTYAI
jgi:hypothetical protein